MAHRATYLSILSLLFLNPLHAQTGEGCMHKTCPQPGQVRINAITDAHGNFAGGCNCGCNPALTNPQSPLFCAEPKIINYDPQTLLGDCSCGCEGGASPNSCIFPQVYQPLECGCGCPSFAPDPNSCVAPLTWRPDLCQCACESGSVGGPCIANGRPVPDSIVRGDCTCDTGSVYCEGNQEPDPVTGACVCPERTAGGLFMPTCEPPLIKDPFTCDCATTTTTLPPVGDIEVVCSAAGACSCPFGTVGTCTMTCDGTTDACKDGLIECNNHGHACIVNCLSGSACAGAAKVIGPVDGSLTVNCIGGQSCEGSTTFSGEKGKDLIVVCEGSQACKGSTVFKFGNRKGAIACNGRPDSCIGGAAFITLPGYEHMPGASFECTGQNCPPNVPVAFSNAALPTTPMPIVPSPTTPVHPHYPNFPPITPAGPPGTAPAPGGSGGGSTIISPNPPIPVVLPDEIVICEGVGVTCNCRGNRACTIKCEAEQCKESTINCPANHDCTVQCMEVSCQTSVINGPTGANLIMDCLGDAACVNTQFNAHESVDVSYKCSGKDACKGATHIHCGSGICDVSCPGEAACDSAAINPNSAVAFTCSGVDVHCPPVYTLPPVPIPTPPPTTRCASFGPCPCNHIQCFAQRDLETCMCECPFEILLKESRGDPTICGNEAAYQIYHSSSCSCDCPPNSQPLGGCLNGQTFNQNTCQCECAGGNTCPGAGVMNLNTCSCGCSSYAPTSTDCSAIGKVLRHCQCDCPIPCFGFGQIQSPDTCACGCPYGTPTARSCESGILDELACQCAPPIASTFCCHTSVPNFKAWQGRCWDEQTEEACLAEPNGRCIWDDTNCHENPPQNGLNPGVACFMREAPCVANANCCSEVCKVDGFCR